MELQLLLPFGQEIELTTIWEYAVLVHNLRECAESIPKLYQERADCENVLDEMKNQWGLSGFSTQDLKRVNVAAKLNVIFANWWNVFVRIGEPNEHKEAITSRPELLHLIAQSVSHAAQQTIRFATHHENAHQVKRIFNRIHRCFSWINSIAEQLDYSMVWNVQLSIAFYAFLDGKLLNVPDFATEGIHMLCRSPPC